MANFVHERSDGVVIAVTNIQLCLAEDSLAFAAALCSEELVRWESNSIITS
jgi:hypothetical protein